MKDIPIIFSAPMILALLRDRKTMTRRLAWRQYPDPEVLAGKNARGFDVVRNEDDGTIIHVRKATPWQNIKAGDRLWIRENFSYQEFSGDRIEEFGGVHYWADGNPSFGDWTRPKPSIHMPRWASRLTLIVTATKIERLQDISFEDCRAEGWPVSDPLPFDDHEVNRDAARDWFSDLWEDLHGVESWRSNPDVVAMSFRVVKQNIDQIST